MSATHVMHYGRAFRILATFPEDDTAAANAFMEANPGAALLCIQAGTAYIAHQDDEGTLYSLGGEPTPHTGGDEAGEVAPELLAELEKAHAIIRHALAVMTTEQKAEWGRLNAAALADGEGITRANERAELIAKAGGKV